MLQAYLVYLLLMAALMVTWKLAATQNVTVGVTSQGFTGGVDVMLAMAATVLLYGLTMGLRDRVGGDYEGYASYYLTLTDREGPSEVPYEWGFYWLIRSLKAFQLPAASLFLATSTFQIFFISAWLRRHVAIAPWYIFFFFTSLLVFESLNTIRQAMAYAVLLYAMPAIRSKCFIRYSLLVGGASLFHSSALLFLPFYFLLDRDWLRQRRWQFALLLIMYLSASALKDALFDLLPIFSVALNYGNYGEVQDALFFEGEGGVPGAGLLFVLLTDAFIILLSPMLRRRFDSLGFRIYYNVYLIGALFTPIVLFANYIPFARLLFYFLAFKPVVLAFAARGWMEEATNRRWGGRMVLVLLVSGYLVWLISAISKKSAWCAPFQFIGQ